MSWHKFYKDRVNSGYQDYFEERYAVMIEAIVSFNPIMVREEGIGIGSVTKALWNRNILSTGFDNCIEMVKLANLNNGGTVAYQDCILNPWKPDHTSDLVVTHGVLEHFQDHDIISIAARHRMQGIPAIHYVPTNKYKEPSFGDERLLSPIQWVELVQAKAYHLFNDGYDLLLIT